MSAILWGERAWRFILGIPEGQKAGGPGLTQKTKGSMDSEDFRDLPELTF